MARIKITNEIVDERLKDTDVARVGNYIGDKVKIEWQCKKCSYSWEQVPNYIFKGAKCPNCSTKKEITNEVFDERIKDLNVIRVGEYKGSNKEIEMKCLACDNSYVTKAKYPMHHKTGCPNCNSQEQYTNETFDKAIKEKSVIRLEDYTDVRTKINFKCKKCSNIWKTSPNHILRGQGCPKCKFDYKRLTNENVDEKVREFDLIRIGNVVDSKTKIDWKCSICENIWSATPNNILRGRKCPVCTLRQKESRVATYLKDSCSKNFDVFTPEYRVLRNPKTNRFLPFDIYIENDGRKFLIEVHGRQHYELVGGYYDSIEDFEYRKEIDLFKKKWAIENDYIFLEVPANFKKAQCDNLVKNIKNNNIKESINYYEKQ